MSLEHAILSKENPYYAWLCKTTSNDFAEEITPAYERIQKFGYKNKFLSKPLLETTDIECVRRIQGEIEVNKEFTKLDSNTRYSCGLAMRYYALYLWEIEVKDSNANKS